MSKLPSSVPLSRGPFSLVLPSCDFLESGDTAMPGHGVPWACTGHWASASSPLEKVLDPSVTRLWAPFAYVEGQGQHSEMAGWFF